MFFITKSCISKLRSPGQLRQDYPCSPKLIGFFILLRATVSHSQMFLFCKDICYKNEASHQEKIFPSVVVAVGLCWSDILFVMLSVCRSVQCWREPTSSLMTLTDWTDWTQLDTTISLDKEYQPMYCIGRLDCLPYLIQLYRDNCLQPSLGSLAVLGQMCGHNEREGSDIKFEGNL